MGKLATCLLVTLAGCGSDHLASVFDAGIAAQSIPDGTGPAELDADDGLQACAVPGTQVAYLHMTTTDTTDSRCDAGANGMCTIDLEGFLYIPAAPSATPRPAIIYNHGSEQLPGPKCSIAEYFVPKGYVVFVPHRRGHGKSTGIYLSDYTAGTQISYLELQISDVTDAFNYVKALPGTGGLPLVDPQKLALMGHSYGGIMTLLTNATSLGQPVAVDLCGDSESWGNTSFNDALNAAVDAAKAPIFFAQPANDVHTDPTVEYAHRAGADKQQFQSAIYPPVPNAATPEDAHSRFVGDADQVALWGSGALDFMHRYGM